MTRQHSRLSSPTRRRGPHTSEIAQDNNGTYYFSRFYKDGKPPNKKQPPRLAPAVVPNALYVYIGKANSPFQRGKATILRCFLPTVILIFYNLNNHLSAPVDI